MKTKAIPVRIPVDWIGRLDAAAARLGTHRATLIAFCAKTFADHFAKKGMAMMPPDWEEILIGLDGRRTGPTVYRIPRADRFSLNEEVNSKAEIALAAEEEADVASLSVSSRKSSKPPAVGPHASATYRRARGAGKRSDRKPSSSNQGPK